MIMISRFQQHQQQEEEMAVNDHHRHHPRQRRRTRRRRRRRISASSTCSTSSSSSRRNTSVSTSLTLVLMILSSSGWSPSPSPSCVVDHCNKNNGIHSSSSVAPAVVVTLSLFTDAYIVDNVSSTKHNKPTEGDRKEKIYRIVQPPSSPFPQPTTHPNQQVQEPSSSSSTTTTTRRLPDLDCSIITATTSPTSDDRPLPRLFGDDDVKAIVGMTDTTTSRATTMEDNAALDDEQREVVVLSPIEAWCLSRMDRWYSTSQSMKCPFTRRRSGDLLDDVESFMNTFIIRPECHQIPQAHRPPGTNKKQNTIKYKHLTPEQIRQIILEDWMTTPATGTDDVADDGTTSTAAAVTNNKGYYITGKLTTGVYRDDCLFLGPDPDMPIHGTRKYVGVASHLFDYKESDAVLHSLRIVPVDELPSVRLRPTAKSSAALRDVQLRDRRLCPYDRPNNTHKNNNRSATATAAAATTTSSNKVCLVADWTLSGILRLPWRPSLPTFSGQTIYHLDDEGLVLCHEESWGCSALQAFCHTLLPDLAERIWGQQQP